MFPTRLTDSRGFDIAQALLDGFNRHYRLFRETSAQAKRRFEQADWHGQQRAQRERIEFYDKRVEEAAERLQREFQAGSLPMDVWQQVKLHYIGLLTNHHQPELAETFFNSVTTKILHRSYFRNDFIFVRPAVSTEYIENDEPASLPTYRAYYPTKDTLRDTLLRVIDNFQLAREFEDLGRDVDHVLAAVLARLGRFEEAYRAQLRSTQEYLSAVSVLNRVRQFSMQVRHEISRVRAQLAEARAIDRGAARHRASRHLPRRDARRCRPHPAGPRRWRSFACPPAGARLVARRRAGP